MPPFRNPMTGRFETNPNEQTIDYQQARYQYQNQLQQNQMQYQSQWYQNQIISGYTYNTPYQRQTLDVSLAKTARNLLNQADSGQLNEELLAYYVKLEKERKSLIEAEKEKAEKEKLYAELADPNSPLYDPLLCLKNGVEYKAPEKKKGTSSTGPR